MIRRQFVGVSVAVIISLITGVVIGMLVRADDLGIPYTERGFATENTYLPLFKNTLIFLLLSVAGLYLLAFIGIKQPRRYQLTVDDDSRHGQFMNALYASGESYETMLVRWHQYYAGLTEAGKRQVWDEYLARHNGYRFK